MTIREELAQRVELYDVISYAMRDWDDYIDECRETETPPIDDLEDFIVDGILSAGYRKQEWIPVTDGLPEKITNKVIVLCKNGYRGFGHYENYKGKQTWYNLESYKPFTDWDLEDCESYEVTHWMPLPQPPEI